MNLQTLPVREDEMQRRRNVCNHESAHATAMLLDGRPVRSIDVNRPEVWSHGHVVPGPCEPLQIPDDLLGNPEAVRGWIDAQMFKSRRQVATHARIGGLVAGHDWLGPVCRSDRNLVLRCCPPGWEPGGWEELVTLGAVELAESERFRRAHRWLAGELLASYYDVMPGARAAEIIEEALRG